jgi:hypothetical protein
MDLQGRVLHNKTGIYNNGTISVAHLLRGVYFYRLTKDGVIIGKGKIVKKN